MTPQKLPMRFIDITVACFLLAACGGGGSSSVAPPSPSPAPPSDPTGLLVPAGDALSLVSAVARLLAPDDSSQPTLELAPPAVADAAGFSTTYRLESDVDELDIVKYDGNRLVIAPSRGGDCCFLIEPATDLALLPPPPPLGESVVRILTTDPGSATASEVGRIPLEGEQRAEGLFFEGDELSVITSSAWWGTHGDSFSSIAAWESQSTSLLIYDIGNPAAPSMEWSLSIEGGLAAGRKIGDQILLVTRHYPQIPDLVLGSTDPDTIANNQAIIDGLSASDVLPRMLIDGEPATGLSEADCRVIDPNHPQAPVESGYPVITSILWLNPQSRQISDILCLAEYADGVYVSSESIYIAQTIYDEPSQAETLIHQFALTDTLEYRGSGRAPGSLTNRNQSDFRMSAVDDVLRLVTTQWTADEADAFDHRLITMTPSSTEPTLDVLDILPSADDQPPIGKPNEDLFGVRFVGDRAYLVTFERIDPLYIIDLSDPSSLQILGELEVPGFSDLLHPVTAELLLGLGDDGQGRVKVELFDIADPTAPMSRGTVLLGENAVWSYSEARYDRRAFSYLPGETTDRFTVPLSIGVETDSGYEQREQLRMLSISDKLNPDAAVLAEVGAIDVPSPAYAAPRPRATIDGDTVFFVLADQVWASFWGSIDAPLGPF